MKKVNLAIFISGKGTNLKSISKACTKTEYPAVIKLVISDNASEGYFLSKKLLHKTILIDKEKSKYEFENEVSFHLKKNKIDLICLAGFMKILSPAFVGIWKNKILNIHPSILPLFPGLNTHSKTIKAGMKIHGSTVHVVTDKLDDGEIIGQIAIPINLDDNIDLIIKKLKKYENILYVKSLEKFIRKNLNIKYLNPLKTKKNKYNEYIISI